MDFFLRQIKPPDGQEKYMIGEKETTEHGVTLVDVPLLQYFTLLSTVPYMKILE